jgi:hypothetical protein
MGLIVSILDNPMKSIFSDTIVQIFGTNENCLLLETGEYLLLETGDKILLEEQNG